MCKEYQLLSAFGAIRCEEEVEVVDSGTQGCGIRTQCRLLESVDGAKRARVDLPFTGPSIVFDVIFAWRDYAYHSNPLIFRRGHILEASFRQGKQMRMQSNL